MFAEGRNARKEWKYECEEEKYDVEALRTELTDKAVNNNKINNLSELKYINI